jgi:uncharacterized protein YgiM (DUF1202 family)
MKKAIVTAALGFGVMVGSLVGGSVVNAAPASGGLGSVTTNIACDCTTLYTTSDLNLRSGPGTSYGVISVIPDGATVQRYTAAGEENGFAKVYYDGNAGWSSLDYLSEDNSGSGSGGFGGYAPEAYDESLITDVGVITSDNVNFRWGPGTDYEIQDLLQEGDQVAWSDVVVNNFRYVWHAGYEGWIYADYVALDEGQYDNGGGVAGGGTDGPFEQGATLVTTSALNLREQPNTSSDVLLVMPEGAKVTAFADAENGFQTVTYNGISGWAYIGYLSN